MKTDLKVGLVKYYRPLRVNHDVKPHTFNLRPADLKMITPEEYGDRGLIVHGEEDLFYRLPPLNFTAKTATTVEACYLRLNNAVFLEYLDNTYRLDYKEEEGEGDELELSTSIHIRGPWVAPFLEWLQTTKGAGE